MTFTSFWKIFFKILGVWLIIQSFTILTQLFSSIFFFFTDQTDSYLYLIISLFLLIIIYVIILWFFIIKPEKIITKLKLDKGFSEDKIEFEMKQSTILTIAIVILGGLMLVEALPSLVTDIYSFIQQKASFVQSPSTARLFADIVKATFGYLIMTNSDFILKFIDKQLSKNNLED